MPFLKKVLKTDIWTLENICNLFRNINISLTWLRPGSLALYIGVEGGVVLCDRGALFRKLATQPP